MQQSLSSRYLLPISVEEDRFQTGTEGQLPSSSAGLYTAGRGNPGAGVVRDRGYRGSGVLSRCHLLLIPIHFGAEN